VGIVALPSREPYQSIMVDVDAGQVASEGAAVEPGGMVAPVSFGTLLRIDQVGDLLLCGEEHVRRLAKRGELCAVNIATGRRVVLRITARSVEEFVRRRVRPGSRPG